MRLRKPSHLKRNAESAFALVIALSLMAFVLLLLLSITTLVQVETRSAQIHSSRVEAQQNAYLGLQIALGELQKTMGPDQRISATADILGASSAVRAKTVGVWASADISSQSLTKGQVVNWLASDANDDEGKLRTDYNTTPSPATASSATLVGVGSLPDLNNDGQVDNLDQQVTIDLTNTNIETNGNTIGKYAWWIGDEGVKARINLDRAEAQLGASKKLSVLEAGSSSVANPAALDGLQNLYSDAGDPIVPLSKLTELDDLDLILDASDSIPKKYFHDLTTWSSGVLADVKNGGLKKDLSLAFEMEDAAFNASELGANGPSTINAPGFGDVQPVFTLDNSTGENAHGPVWHLLRDYYRLYHLMEKPMTNPTLDARVFGPNVNHGEPSLALGSELTNSPAALDKQPAILFAGGKVKFYNQGYNNGPVGGGPGAFASSRHKADFSKSAIDFSLRDADPARLEITGDPLRGGGLSNGGTTMPVMVTGTYMPYLMRFIAEMGVWFSPYSGSVLGTDTAYVHLNEVTREAFVLHNPYNVRLRHEEIGVDCFGFDIQYSLEDPNGTPESFYNKNNGSLKNTTEQQESERQVRLKNGSFGSGEIKTYAANNYGNSSSATVQYATQGANPIWHHYKFANPNTLGAFLFERPAIPSALKNAPTFLTLNIHGGTSHPALTNPPYHKTDAYSVSSIFFATYLKQSGNSAFDGLYLRDRWPLASAVDTAILLPGPRPFTVQPGSGSRMFPAEQKQDVTDNLINLHTTPDFPLTTANFDFQLKPAEYLKSDDYQVRYPAFTRSNPLAPVRDNKNLLPADDFITNSVGFPKLSPDTDVVMARDGAAGLSSSFDRWGPTDGQNGGVSNPVLIELPTGPVLSLGKLQHSNLSIHAHMPALAVGNSLASVYIPKDQTFTTFENYYGQERIFYDLSYLMNEALWDSYYFSSYSIPYNDARDDFDESGSSASDMFDAVATGNLPLPNSRMALSTSAGESVEEVRTKLFNGTVIGNEAYKRAAENLMVQGSFNVNSTSVTAWRAVLSGARDSAIYQSGAAAESSLTAGNTPFSRFTQPVAGESTDSSGSPPDEWAGFRSLSDAEIENLATEVVTEIRKRVDFNKSPYLSLSDFVNRELTNRDFGRTGVIQAAIDRAGLNDGMSISSATITEGSLDDANNGRFTNPDNILLANGSDGSGSMSAPTYLMQADVLQAIGSFISVRSDTFRIRSYGQSLDPISGQLLAEVWYEAIVQRTPEPVNPSSNLPQNPDYWTALDTNGGADAFGRRFKVLSIRQLSKDEV